MRKLGKYLLIEPIASGGMAEVWRAEVAGPAGFVKQVAVKLVRSDRGDDDEMVRMFLQEARLAGSLHHANIVHVFDLDFIEGRYAIAMELVHSKTLREVLDRCREQNVRFGLSRAVNVAAQVARALAYAHRPVAEGGVAGLVHRDVSPHNVLVSFEGEVKLTDFGIARVPGTGSLTGPGMLKGKLGYMAPEQASDGPVDARADLFALGVVLWETCTGQRLFARDNEVATLRALTGADPVVPPSFWNEGVPPALDAIVLGRPGARSGPADRHRRRGRGPARRGRAGALPHAGGAGPAPPHAPPLAGGDAVAPHPDARAAAGVPAASPSPAEATTATWPAPPCRAQPGPVRARAPRGHGGGDRVVGGLRTPFAGLEGDAGAGRGGECPVRPDGGPRPGSRSGPHRAVEPPPAPARRRTAPEAPAADRRGAAPGLPPPARPPSRPRRRPAVLASADALEGLEVPPAATGEGILFVNALPWAEIHLDGRVEGYTPREMRLAAGRHRLRLVHPTRGTVERVAEVRAGERLRVEIPLQP